MSSGNTPDPQGFQAQDVDPLPSQLRMIAAALEANKQSFSAAMVMKAADRIEELEKQPTLSRRDHFALRAPVSFEMVGRAYGASGPNLVDDAERAAFFAVGALLAREWADALISELDDHGRS